MQIAGLLLNAIFLDDHDRDALNLARLNRVAADLPLNNRHGLRTIDLVFVRPSQDIGRLAADVETKIRDAVRAGRLDKAPGDILPDAALTAGIISRDEYEQVRHADRVRDESSRSTRFERTSTLRWHFEERSVSGRPRKRLPAKRGQFPGGLPSRPGIDRHDRTIPDS